MHDEGRNMQCLYDEYATVPVPTRMCDIRAAEEA